MSPRPNGGFQQTASDPTITCPQCRTEIRLTESLAAPLLESTRKQFEERLRQKDAEVSDRESAVLARQAELEQAKQSLDERVAAMLKERTAAIAAEEAKKARLLLGSDLDAKAQELNELKEVLQQREGKLAEAQKAQAELVRKQRELDDAKRVMDLTIEKRIQESLAVTREKAKKEAEDELKLKVSERDHTIASMQKQIEELKRRAEQGSQQLQGEVQELDLEQFLAAKFPLDEIEPVPKGEHGGDDLQRVIGPGGVKCGTILWESKRTKHWSDTWLAKLREDRRHAPSRGS